MSWHARFLSAVRTLTNSASSHAEDVLSILGTSALKPHRVSRSADGAVLFQFNEREVLGVLECYDDGAVLSSLIYGDGAPDVREIAPEDLDEGIQEFVATIIRIKKGEQ